MFTFQKKQEIPIDDPAFSENLTLASVEKWRRLRNIITPTFSTAKLRQVKPRIDDTVAMMLKNFDAALEREVAQNGNKSYAILDVKPLFDGFAMDATVAFAYGIKVDSLIDPQHPVVVNVRKIISLDSIDWRNLANLTVIFLFPKVAQLLRLRYNGQATNFFMDFYRKIIDEKRNDLGKNKKKASSFIELMLEEELNDEAMKDENFKQLEKCKKFIVFELYLMLF